MLLLIIILVLVFGLGGGYYGYGRWGYGGGAGIGLGTVRSLFLFALCWGSSAKADPLSDTHEGAEVDYGRQSSRFFSTV
jgi:hypothetical protein